MVRCFRSVLTPLVLAAALFVLVPGDHLRAGSDDPELTGPWRNGRYWTALSTSGKLAYVVGCSDGYFFLLAMTHPNFETAKPLIGAFPQQTYGEIIEMLDRLYSVPENRRIAIVTAIWLNKAKSDGQSESEFNAAVEEARAKASAPGPAKREEMRRP